MSKAWLLGGAIWLALVLLSLAADRGVYENVSGPVGEAIGFKTWRYDRPAGGRATALEEVLLLSKRMGHFFFVVFISGTMLAVTPGRRRQVVVLWSCALCAAAVGQGGLKLSVAKLRPDALIPAARAQEILAADGPDALVRHDGRYHNRGRAEFRGAFSGYRDPRGLTFPSGHAGLAFALFAALAALYPRGRWWFFGLACGVGAGRVLLGEHFLSDVVGGAGVGYASASFVLTRPRVRAFLEVASHPGDAPPAA